MIDGQNDVAERVSIQPADLSSVYEVRLTGTADGEFDLAVEIPDRSTGELRSVAYMDVPVTLGGRFGISLERSTDFALWMDLDGDGEFETSMSPTDVSSRSLDLPVNLTLEGSATEHGSFDSDVTATLSPSSRQDATPITTIEYDLGDGWQTYSSPFVISGAGDHGLRYRGRFADGRDDATQNVVIRIEENNTPPVANAGPDQVVLEGDWVTLSGAGSSDADGDTLSYLWETVSADGPPITLVSPAEEASQFLALDNGTYTFRLTVDDGRGGTASDEVVIVVDNSPPAIGAITAPLSPQRIGTVVEVSGGFTDAGVDDTHTAMWTWGDGSASEGYVTGNNGSGIVVADHTYASPGVYTLLLRVADDDGGATSASFQYVVIYDPDGGFVTGGGWFYTPQGSYAADPSFTGRTHIGFNAKYQQGASLPSGEIQLTLQGNQFVFHGGDYEWLVVTGSRAQVRGTGSLDGQGGYGFLLSVVDASGSGGQDVVRMKIWRLQSGEVIYDSLMGHTDDEAPTAPLDGGSVVVHSGN